MQTPEERFWLKVEKGPDCWLWTRASVRGYGRFRVGNQTVGAHRFSYELAYGPIPAGLLVLHSCDNPPCVNPAHLRAGTELDNMRDRSARGRATGGVSPLEKCAKGHADWYVNPKTGWKHCRPCRAAYMREWRHLKTLGTSHN